MSEDQLMFTLFVSDFRVLKEDPPPDAIEVQVLSQETDSGPKDIHALYEFQNGKDVRVKIVAKFWAAPDQSP